MGSVSNLIESVAARPILGIKQKDECRGKRTAPGYFIFSSGFGRRTTPRGLDLSLLDRRGHRRGGKQPIHIQFLDKSSLVGPSIVPLRTREEFISAPLK